MAPETIAGRYHVERAVGRGGMGTVWLCRDELLGRQVAVKEVGTLPGEATPDLARALREARSSAALNHRNVVSIYDAVEEGDHIWLVMEYVPSRTLSQLLAQDGPLPPERVAWIGAQVAAGLAAAHARRTIHRDVKPGNILVTEDDLAKVSDFGIARTHGDTTLTESGLVTGTPTYFSPELARGAEPSPAADVWALGATLYTAVEGKPPFPGQPNPIATLAMIATGDPPRPERAGFLTTPITRMLDPDLATRWSMADAAHALQRLHEQHQPKDDTAVFAAPAGVGAAATVAARADDPRVQPDDREAEPDDSPADPEDRDWDDGSATEPREDRKARRGWLVPLVSVVLLALVAAGGLVLLNHKGDGSSATGSSTAKVTPTPSGSRSASASTGQGPTSSASSGPSVSPQSSSSADSSPPVAGSSGERFGSSYYAVLPGDTRKGWSMLSPAFQSRVGSYGDYRGFWSTIRSVDVRSTKAAGNNAVDVSLAYTNNDGSVQTEVRRLFLERAGNGYLISSDKIVG
jgi:serine/threonine protein kinase